MKRIALAVALLLPATTIQAGDLAAAYALAGANDPSLRAARATRDANLEAKPLARAQLLPNVSLSGDITHNDQDIEPVVARRQQ